MSLTVCGNIEIQQGINLVLKCGQSFDEFFSRHLSQSPLLFSEIKQKEIQWLKLNQIKNFNLRTLYYITIKTFQKIDSVNKAFFVLILTTAPKFFFFWNKTFLFFKIESWNFQAQFEIEFRETLQNFNSIRQPIEKKMKITIVLTN